MGRAKARVHIGTSGWHYLHWKGPYYPKDLPAKDFLTQYAKDFQTVEINNTFYKLPEVTTLIKWQAEVPKNFLFSVKASRYITHVKKLKDPKSTLKKFFSRIEHLKKNIAVILFQLPPKWSLNLERFEEFLQALPKGYRYSFEFRDSSWLCEEVYALLKKRKHTLCLYEFAGKKTPHRVTAKFVYVRLHGPKRAYQGSYSSRVLDTWAKQFNDWAKKGIEVFCYFDNDEKGYAPKNALKLMEKL
jgi:uncharacterized protein YecE (DUF72 family)